MLKILLNKLVHIALTFLVFVYIIFEELIWETIAKPVYEFIHSLKILKKLELMIDKLNRFVILVIFLSLFIQAELLGVISVAFLAKGKIYSSILIYLGKIPIGAFTFWIFNISKNKLMTFNWFKITYNYIMKLIDKIQSSEIYRNIKLRTKIMKKYMKTKFLKDGSSIKEKIKNIYQSIKKIFK